MHPTIIMLLQRMDEHPDEFVNADWKPVMATGHNLYHPTRWERISDLMSEGDPFGVGHPFSEEERTAYNTKVRALVKDRVVEGITKELLSRERSDELEFKNKQLSLYGGASPNPYSNPTSAKLPTAKTMMQQTQQIMQDHIDGHLAAIAAIGLPKDILK